MTMLRGVAFKITVTPPTNLASFSALYIEEYIDDSPSIPYF